MRYRDHSMYDQNAKPQAPPLEPGDYYITLEGIRDTDRDGNAMMWEGDQFVNFLFSVKGHSKIIWHRVFYLDSPAPEGSPYAETRSGQFKQMLLALGGDVGGGETDQLVGRSCWAYVTKTIKGDKIYNNIGEFKVETEATPAPKDDGYPF